MILTNSFGRTAPDGPQLSEYEGCGRCDIGDHNDHHLLNWPHFGTRKAGIWMMTFAQFVVTWPQFTHEGGMVCADGASWTGSMVVLGTEKSIQINGLGERCSVQSAIYILFKSKLFKLLLLPSIFLKFVNFFVTEFSCQLVSARVSSCQLVSARVSLCQLMS